MQTKLDTWNAEIETLSGSSCTTTPELRSTIGRQIDTLQSKLAIAWQKIELAPDAQRAD